MDKDRVIKARCSPTIEAALDAIAETERRTRSETLREVVREAAKSRGLWPPGERKEGNVQPCAA